MATNASETLMSASENARLSRWFDFLCLVPILFVMAGAFHLNMMLTVGDWDFWLDWKDQTMVAFGDAALGDHVSCSRTVCVMDEFQDPSGRDGHGLGFDHRYGHHSLLCLSPVDQLSD